MIKLSSYSKSVIYRILILFAISTICRILFHVLNRGFFETYSSLDLARSYFFGIMFDASAIAYFAGFSLILSFIPFSGREHKRLSLIHDGLFTFGAFMILLLNAIDFFYFPFSKRRTGAELLGVLKDVVLQWKVYAASYWYAVILLFVFVFLLYKLFRKVSTKHQTELVIWTKKKYVIQTGLYILWLGFIVLMARNLYLRPLRTSDAVRFVDAGLIPLATNTPLQFITSMDSEKVPDYDYQLGFDPETILKFRKESRSSTLNNKNVLVIIVESLGKEYMGYYDSTKVFTPFLDSLCRVGTAMNYSFANGQRSIEAMPSLLSSIPSLMDQPYSTSAFQTNTLHSFGSLLAKQGYTTGFYHGGINGTMSFDNFVNVSGFGKYYGKNEYIGNKTQDDDGHWGIRDEPYLKYIANQLKSSPKPFCNAVFTLSSHDPFIVPEPYDSKLPKGDLPIHHAMAYTDLCLRKFFHDIKNEAWYNNTVFVITGDHTSLSNTKKYQTPKGNFEVPIIFFQPNQNLGIDKKKVSQQIDIMPTVLDITGYSGSYYSEGKSLMSTDSTRYAVNYYQGIFQLIDQQYLIQFDGKSIVAVFDHQHDELFTKNMLADFSKDKLKIYERYIKAFVQAHFMNLKRNTTY